MVWPTTLTANADITKFIFEQGITRKLEPGVDYNDLHEGVAIEVRLWLESHGVPDADKIRNTADFKPAAAHLFWAKVIRNRDPVLSEIYIGKFLALMKSTRPNLGQGDDPATSGTAAKVVVIKQGRNRYTTRRSGAIFKDYRTPTS